MRIAILGTKGIPNNYGGFEQFAEYLSIGLVKLGHQVTVYNPSFHPFSESSFNGVGIEKVFSPEKFIGGAANFIYDHLCLKHALTQNFDIIYEAGYHSVALSYRFLKIKNLTKPAVLTNMDGLEWKRSKWNFLTRRLIRKLEEIAIRESPYLISDNEGIRNYYLREFNRDSFFLPYGADPVEDANANFLISYGIEPNRYFILVARLEPENNIDMVIDGYLRSSTNYPLLVVGNHKTPYGNYLKKFFRNVKVRFIGGVYNKSELDALRQFSLGYFHGHSVGGTNPSLLEAMACHCFILAHGNEFNRSVLQESAFYFENKGEIINLVKGIDQLRKDSYKQFERDNTDRIQNQYNWSIIVRQHESLFKSLI